MGYNELDIGDKHIEGHKYIGGGCVDIQVGQLNIDSTHPLTGTFSDDGVFLCPFHKLTDSYTIIVYINDVLVFVYDNHTAPAVGVVSLPVKKGDTFKVSTNAPNGSNHYFTLQNVVLSRYRT